MATRATAVAVPLLSCLDEVKKLVWEKQFHQMSTRKRARCLHMKDRNGERRWDIACSYLYMKLCICFPLTLQYSPWPDASFLQPVNFFGFAIFHIPNLSSFLHPASLSYSPSSYFLYKTTDKKINPCVTVCVWCLWLPVCLVSRPRFCTITLIFLWTLRI